MTRTPKDTYIDKTTAIGHGLQSTFSYDFFGVDLECTMRAKRTGSRVFALKFPPTMAVAEGLRRTYRSTEISMATICSTLK